MARFDISGRPPSVAALRRAWANSDLWDIMLNGAGPMAVRTGTVSRNPRAIVLGVFQYIFLIEREMGIGIDALLKRRDADPILVAASLRVRNRLLGIPTRAQLDLSMKLPHRRRKPATEGVAE